MLKLVEKDPGLTHYANELLAQIESGRPTKEALVSYQLDSLGSESLRSLASKNAFNESLILQVVAELAKREESGGYELLVEAIEINPYATGLLKEYILIALDWGLNAYSDHAMSRLETLVTAEEYEAFTEVYEARKQEASQADWQ